MTRLLFYMACEFLFCQANAQSKAGIEQYNYIDNSGINAIIPVLHIESKSGWHCEVRYNYEAAKTFSFYGGKSFSHRGVYSWTITPMAGFLAGNFKGGSAAVNLSIESKNFFLSSLPEFVVSMSNENKIFFYNWSELGYNINDHIYAGISLQQTVGSLDNEAQAGVTTGFRVKNFTFPVYFFDPFQRVQYFIVGINWEWNKNVQKNLEGW